jgi:succinoglycan biosynthesis protein ExoO
VNLANEDDGGALAAFGDDMSTRVSVIMANLNGAAHIAEAVRSVLSQTEPALELLLCDDGSTDDSLARAEAAAAGDARLRIVPAQSRPRFGAGRLGRGRG